MTSPALIISTPPKEGGEIYSFSIPSIYNEPLCGLL